MHVRLLFPSRYLCAADFDGKDVDLTITSIRPESLRTEAGDEFKHVVRFKEVDAKAEASGSEPKRLVLNETCAMAIAAIHGNEVNDWAGKKITLYPTTCQAFGETVECIRVRPAKGA